MPGSTLYLHKLVMPTLANTSTSSSIKNFSVVDLLTRQNYISRVGHNASFPRPFHRIITA